MSASLSTERESCLHSQTPNKSQADPLLLLFGFYFWQISKVPRSEESDKGGVICISALCCFCLSHYSSSDSPPFILLKSSFHPVPRLLRSGSPFTLVSHWLERHREASNLLTVTDGCAEAHNGGSRASSPCSWPSKEKPKAGVWPEGGRFN